MNYTYTLKSNKDNRLYVGLTNDLRKRCREHNEGIVFSTKRRRPLTLIYYEACTNRSDAALREKYLKTSWGKRYLKNRLR